MCNTLDFYDEKLIAPHSTPKLEDHPFSAVQYIRNYTYAKFMFPESLLFTCRILFVRRCNPCYIFSLFHLFTLHILYSIYEKGVACTTNGRVRKLTLRLLMSYIYIYIYGAHILDVSRSHTTTHHSR